MDADLSAMHAAGFIFLIIFGFFVENHLLAKNKIEFLRLTVEELQALQAKGLIFLMIFGFFVENHLLAKHKISTTYSLRIIIFAGNTRPYFSHYFRILC